MTPEELIKIVRTRGKRVVPLVGAGLALDAGAPSASAITAELIRRFGLGDPSLDLTEAAQRAAAASSRLDMQTVIADVVARTRPRPTPALTALVAGPAQVVLTTNYDDAIEQAARARGATPVSMAATDPRILDTPGPGEVHVIHLHGVTEDPSSIVLPGEQMEELISAERFQRLLTAAVVPHHLLYLGFAFGSSEVHLRALVEWLATELDDVREHWLPLGESQVRGRHDDLRFFEEMGNVEVVPYDDRRDHTAVVQIACALAPRGYDRAEDEHVDQRLTWVQPVCVAQKEEGEGPDELEQRMWGFDFNGSSADVVSPESLEDYERCLVVATPGMGKTKLVSWLPFRLGSQCAVGRFRDFRAVHPGHPDRDIMRLLVHQPRGEQVSVDEWQGAPLTVIIDGLDELDPDLHACVLASLKAMAAEVPQHRLILTTRPVQAVPALIGLGFRVWHILPSRRWAKKYLETRALTAELVARAQASNTLGDLAVIPLFSELLADRLLDAGEPIPEALDLLVTSQQEAIDREARRMEVEKAPLEDWLRSLALGLQLRGKTSIPTAQLTLGSVSAPSADTVERLRRASVLGDRPNEAAFARRTFQEALVADSILNRRYPRAALESAAVAEINGRSVIREDFDFVADLVFEHASRAEREQLRDLDPERWARTVALHGTLEDGRDAFVWFETWHRQRRISYLNFVRRSVLRSYEGAVITICERWPEIVTRRKRRLIRDLASGSSDQRARALTALGTLPRDADTESWLIPCLADSDEHIVVAAQRLVGRYSLTAAVPALIEHLNSRSARLSGTALRALIDTLPGDRLNEIGPHLGPQDPPVPIAEDLARVLNLDDALAFLASLRTRPHTCTWLLDRLVDSTPAHAWTEERVRVLMGVLAISGHPTDPDYSALGGVLSSHLEAALAAVRPRRSIGSSHQWYVPRDQTAALLAIDPAVLAASHPSDELKMALEAAIEDKAERDARLRRQEDAQTELREVIDRDGDQIDLMSVIGTGALRLLDPERRATLARAVDRAWPTAALASEESWAHDLALEVGAEIRAPIAPDRWWQLLEAYVPGTGLFGFRREGVGLWLAASRPPGITDELCARISDCVDARGLYRLLIVADVRDASVAGAACERLLRIDPEQSEWVASARYLLESGSGIDIEALLMHAGPNRGPLVAALARKGDPPARLEIIEELATQVAKGEDPEPPSWPNVTYDPSFCPALAQLARAAPEGTKALSFAVNGLTQISDPSSLVVLEQLAARRVWWIELAAEQAAARLGTARVLERLDDSVFEAAQAFLAS